MRAVLRLMAVACLLVGLTAERASADIVYKFELNNATFRFGNDPAGGLTGSFTMNSDLSEVLAANIIATAADPKKNKHFELTKYVIPNDPVTTVASVTKQGSDLEIKFDNGEDWLRLIFKNGLATTGSTVLKTNSSLEHQDGSGNRSIVSGAVTASSMSVDPPVAAVPEPSTIAVVAICAPALLAYGWRRRKAMEAA